MNEAVPLVAFWMAVVLLAAVLVLTLVLVFVRTLRGFVRPRAAARESRIRGLLVEGLLGDRGEEANHSLLAMRGRDGDTLEHQAARMVVRLKGEVLDQVRSLLLDRGVGPRAQALARSRGAVRRSRGAHLLGALAAPEHLPDLLRLLDDPVFPVRRLAVIGIGATGDASAVPTLLECVGGDPRLQREFLLAISDIGPPARPALHEGLRHAEGPEDPRAVGATVALGVVGDARDVPLLVPILRGGGPAGLHAARALGQLGGPNAVQPLVDALGSDDPELRLRAAEALAEIGSPHAAPGLAAALDHDGHEFPRAVCRALLAIGPSGIAELERHPSPYATEALAVRAVVSA